MMIAALGTGNERHQVVFVQDFAIVDQPYDLVAARFCADIANRLGGAMQAARAESDLLQRKAAPRGWPGLLARTIDIDVGSVRNYEDGLLVSFTWQAHNRSSLFPIFDADLQLSPIGSTQTQLILRGRYRPPIGTLGRHADQLLLHRVADATIRAFLTDIASDLAQPPERETPETGSSEPALPNLELPDPELPQPELPGLEPRAGAGTDLRSEATEQRQLPPVQRHRPSEPHTDECTARNPLAGPSGEHPSFRCASDPPIHLFPHAAP